ncbi:MAG: hypothetical protein AVDCRST_MAG19-698 [uncultured Thermomicrobiales bacterium]|uniref:Uncharacterized protein n=1 Tax=uncultured Thermomicrobiales bacterium TaxID=1645740 RepID=A0A6J4UFY0_9BACT|nr:MAG: hypothetical protein AVDCRST_MAG19-698 [uncultured Thermomicrobiales bacterium]
MTLRARNNSLSADEQPGRPSSDRFDADRVRHPRSLVQRFGREVWAEIHRPETAWAASVEANWHTSCLRRSPPATISAATRDGFG